MTETKKTKEDLAAEEAAAKQQLQAILDASRPKHLGQTYSSPFEIMFP